MAREFGRWFRFYDSVLDDPKVQRLSDPLFRAWVNLMCIANRNNGVISADFKDIAFSLRMPESKARAVVQALVAAGLIDNGNGTLEPHNWTNRQFQSDVSTDRVKRFRERRRNVSCNGDGTPSETPPDTDTDTDTDTETDTETEKKEEREETRAARASPPESPPVSQPKPKVQKGSRWPEDAVVPEDWLTEGAAYRENANLPLIDLRAEALKFANYWASKSGGSATKINWKRTWLNWCLEARNAGQNGRTQGQFGAVGQIDELRRIAQRDGGAQGKILDG